MLACQVRRPSFKRIHSARRGRGPWPRKCLATAECQSSKKHIHASWTSNHSWWGKLVADSSGAPRHPSLRPQASPNPMESKAGELRLHLKTMALIQLLVLPDA